jgi:hypothetical protein
MTQEQRGAVPPKSGLGISTWLWLVFGALFVLAKIHKYFPTASVRSSLVLVIFGALIFLITICRKWPLWKYMMFMLMPAIGYAAFEGGGRPNGEFLNLHWLVWIFIGAFTFTFTAMAKCIHEDAILKAQNPEYVTTMEIFLPIVAVVAILKIPTIIAIIFAVIVVIGQSGV